MIKMIRKRNQKNINQNLKNAKEIPVLLLLITGIRMSLLQLVGFFMEITFIHIMWILIDVQINQYIRKPTILLLIMQNKKDLQKENNLQLKIKLNKKKRLGLRYKFKIKTIYKIEKIRDLTLEWKNGMGQKWFVMHRGWWIEWLKGNTGFNKASNCKNGFWILWK